MKKTIFDVKDNVRTPRSGIRLLVLSLLVLLFTVSVLIFQGCRPPVIQKPSIGSKPRVGLVLSGGASRGFAHVGVIKVLEEEGIPIDIVVGTSAGSLTGAMYAHYADADILEKKAREMEVDDIFDFSIISIGLGVVKGERILKFVEKNIGVKNIEELKIPFAAVATDIYTGDRVVFKRGSISTAVRASSAIPGVFKPVSVGQRLLVDGGVVDNLPIDVARSMGADIVIAVDISSKSTNYRINTVVDVILQTINIMGSEINKYKVKDSDVVIRPDVSGVGMIDFSKKDYLFLQGERAARKAIPEIRRAMTDSSK
jgi:NTE family protein